jgi:Mrp family chromosome partitioning ATPase/capsular polysaccharide biosynthesis protein
MNDTTNPPAIFAPLWKRKWLILAVGILVAGATYFYYKRATPVYQSTTQIYLGAGAEEQAPGEKGSAKTLSVNAGNQAAIINSIVVEGVRQRLRKEHGLAAANGVVRAKAAEKSQFLVITAEAHRARSTVLLANATAQAYIKRQHIYYQRSISTAISIARRQLRKIEASSASSTAAKSGTPNGSKGAAPASPSTSTLLQSAGLSSKINQLEAALAVTGAQQVKPARLGTTHQLSPKPKKNAIFGFVIGLLLAAVAAYAFSRLDRRLRSLDAIESVFSTQILTALPTVKRPIINRDGVRAPSRLLLEPLRRLHTNLQLLDVSEHAPDVNGRGTHPRTILFTSADAGDGKSTLVADLALVQSDAGARVAVVEANLRRPVQSKLLDARAPHGLAEVLAGTLSIGDAMQRVQSASPAGGAAEAEPATNVATTTMVKSREAGSLSLLAGAPGVGNPPALLASDAMRELLRSLAEDFDYVLIDAPSPLEVSDVMPLLPLVDGIVIVARVGHTRETSAQRLVQLLGNASSATLLGTAANGVAASDINRYGFSSSSPQSWRRTLTGR